MCLPSMLMVNTYYNWVRTYQLMDVIGNLVKKPSNQESQAARSNSNKAPSVNMAKHRSIMGIPDQLNEVQFSAPARVNTEIPALPDRMKNFFSQLIDDTLDEEERKNNPELVRVKNNILLLLLILSAYGVFYLIGDFVDILLTAYIAGIAYQQMRDRFISLITRRETYQVRQIPWGARIFKAICWSIVGFMLPRFQYMLSYPYRITTLPEFSDYLYSIKKNTNAVVIFCESLIIIYILFLLFGPYLAKIGQRLRPSNHTFVKLIFAFLIITVLLFALFVIPSVMFREVSSVGYMVQMQIEDKLGCQILGYENHDNGTLPFCSEKITTENQFIRQTVAQFRNQNQTIEMCLKFVDKMQRDYIGNKVFDYDEIACTWYSFFEKASNYSGFANPGPTSPALSSMVSTGTNIFKTVFGNLALILGGLSNFIFSFTTFVTMFFLTVQFSSQSETVKEIFSQNKKELISSITNLIQATFFIVMEHFCVSIILLEIFNYTTMNLVVSTLLSSMAFFPFFRPWFGVLLVAIFRILLLGEYYISLSFVVIYYLVSQKIYSFHYRKMGFHEIITNMSVLFGIYRFGIAGIFYGPLIVILYKFVEKELLMKELTKRPPQSVII